MDFREQVTAFVDAFNVDDLDQVMSFFSDDAEYITYDGRRRQGPADIRAEFRAQFAGRYGQLRFIRDKLVVDAQNQMAAVSWRCEHGLEGNLGSAPLRLLQRAVALVVGPKPYWEGVDLLRFENGKLAGKYTYAQTRLPRFRRGS